MSRYVFVTGGVVSSLGKGIAASGIGALLQFQGFSVNIKKLDPYLNIDPGTMNPNQHGEVFVTEDGAETDLDLGHYERFANINTTKYNSITSGKIYADLISRERKGEYLGMTVQVVPHVTNLIKEFITSNNNNADFVICEIGGTVGDIEALPFLEAIRQLRWDLGSKQTIYVHLTLVPYIQATKELKTKPTQHSVKALCSLGIQPDILICRSERMIPENDLKKIGAFCNVNAEDVIPAIDVKNIYEVPLSLADRELDLRILAKSDLPSKNSSSVNNLKTWKDFVNNIYSISDSVQIAIVGKYTNLEDSYKSLIEALDHAGIKNNAHVVLKWVDSRSLTSENITQELRDVNGILVPGGFGNEGVEGKILAIKYARENNIPFLGICFGMQLAAIEACRNLLGISSATSSEFGVPNGTKIVGMLSEWENDGVTEIRGPESDLGGTMRLGAYKCILKEGTLARKIYMSNEIFERHRHRYEVDISITEPLEKVGIIFSGISPDGKLPEIMENKNHRWFIGVQFHPEYKSRPFAPHSLFVSFIEECKK